MKMCQKSQLEMLLPGDLTGYTVNIPVVLTGADSKLFSAGVEGRKSLAQR